MANFSIAGKLKESNEEELIKLLTENKVKVNFAAGNFQEAMIKERCDNSFPACLKYDSSLLTQKEKSLITVVGTTEVSRANFGTAVDVMETGCYASEAGRMCGTSQATAIYSAKVLNDNRVS